MLIKELQRVVARYEKLPQYWQRYSALALEEMFEEVETLMLTGATWEEIPGVRQTAALHIPVKRAKPRRKNAKR